MSLAAIPEGLTPTVGIPFSVIDDTLNVAFASMAIPLVVVLFWVAKPAHWRRPGPWLCLVAFIFLCTAAINAIVINQAPLMHPSGAVPHTREIVNITLLYLLPWVSDLAITLRLFAIFPVRWTSRTTLVCIFAFPFAIKAARLGMAIWYVDYAAGLVQRSKGFADLGSVNKVLSINFAEYVSQVCDNTYASVLFFVKLRGTIDRGTKSGIHRSRLVNLRLRRLLLITVACFFIPVLPSFALIIVAAVGDYQALAYTTVVNGGLNVLNVLLCTLLPMVGIINDEKAEKDAKAACESKFAPTSDAIEAAKDTVKLSLPPSSWPAPSVRRVYPEVVHITPLNVADRPSADVRTSPSIYSDTFSASYKGGFLNSYHAGNEKGRPRSSEAEVPLDDLGSAASASSQARRCN